VLSGSSDKAAALCCGPTVDILSPLCSAPHTTTRYPFQARPERKKRGSRDTSEFIPRRHPVEYLHFRRLRLLNQEVLDQLKMEKSLPTLSGSLKAQAIYSLYSTWR